MPPVLIQIFGVLLVTAITAAGIVQKSDTILLAVLGLTGGFVLLGGFYEKVRRDVARALDPGDPPEASP